jgi:dehydrogenase/reductase SDR family protein 7
MLLALVAALSVALLGIYFASDADLRLYLAPAAPANAFEGQVVWIVGASSGIGASLAKDFAASGAQVIISARRLPMLQTLQADVAAAHPTAPKIHVLPLDVTDYAAHAAAVANVYELFHKVDVLVLNAGQSQRNLAVDAPFADTEKLMNLNFLSLVALNKHVLPHMIQARSGKIVVMSSVSGIIATPIASSYSASKFALHGYFDALRTEVSTHNVQVALVCPGPVESEISEKTLRNPALPKQHEGRKMPTARCTALILKGLHHNLEEMWISEHPFLLFTYLAQYFPGVARWYGTKIAGPARVRAITSGENIYDLKTVFGLNKK